MESISEYLVRKLKEVGPAGWPAIQEGSGVSVHLMRKIAYGDRKNPGIKTVEKLYAWLRENEAQEAAASEIAEKAQA